MLAGKKAGSVERDHGLIDGPLQDEEVRGKREVRAARGRHRYAVLARKGLLRSGNPNAGATRAPLAAAGGGGLWLQFARHGGGERPASRQAFDQCGLPLGAHPDVHAVRLELAVDELHQAVGDLAGLLFPPEERKGEQRDEFARVDAGSIGTSGAGCLRHGDGWTAHVLSDLHLPGVASYPGIRPLSSQGESGSQMRTLAGIRLRIPPSPTDQTCSGACLFRLAGRPWSPMGPTGAVAFAVGLDSGTLLRASVEVNPVL